MEIVWTIAGSDSSAGAGIQADLKTMHGLGVYGCSVVTALTAQNTTGVRLIEPVSPAMLENQLHALQEDLPPKAIKLGMLYSQEITQLVAATLKSIQVPVVCDPVAIASSGDLLSQPNLASSLRSSIFPLAEVVTPNLQEAQILLNEIAPVNASDEEYDRWIENLAAQLMRLGAKSVLIKGGHRDSSFCQDLWQSQHQRWWLTSARINARGSHGTGCTLSSAIASVMAQGYSTLDAIVVAKAYVNQGLRHASSAGNGSGSLGHLSWPTTEEDLPWITATASEGRNRPGFTRDHEIGFYPIVNRADWIELLARAGVQTIQLRIKDLDGAALEEEIARANQYAKKHGCNLYINDHWQIAAKHGVFGVHLGQEDLDSVSIELLRKSGLRLGVSTHCYSEVARALGCNPSYIALGPIYQTTTKQMKFAPQGLDALRRWRKSLSSYPLVAIGGIFLGNAQEVLHTGVESVAVVRDIMQSDFPERQAGAWLKLFKDPRGPILPPASRRHQIGHHSLDTLRQLAVR
jgi:hydroxymethylpyrimidine kinase/phosphomethylpyrimidine kinase/thiamine-phosphate diphosphorylase